MTKLKTLKDFEKEMGSALPIKDRIIYYEKNDLRQEAIKWIKECHSDCQEDKDITTWIAYFFNLSREDWKNK